MALKGMHFVLVCFPRHACTTETWLNMLVAGHVRSSQHNIVQYVIRKKLATIQPMHSCPYCLESVLV